MRLIARAPEAHEQDDQTVDPVERVRRETRQVMNMVVTLGADAVELPMQVVGYMAGRTAGGVKRIMEATKDGWEGKSFKKAASLP